MSPAPPWRIRVGLNIGDGDLLAIMSSIRSLLGVCMVAERLYVKGVSSSDVCG